MFEKINEFLDMHQNVFLVALLAAVVVFLLVVQPGVLQKEVDDTPAQDVVVACLTTAEIR